MRAGAWDVRTSLVGDDATAINEAALVDLDNGATSLHLDLCRWPSTWPSALQGVLLDLAPVTLDRPDAEQSEALARLLEDTADDPHPGNNLSADPATALMFGEGVAEGGQSLAEHLRRRPSAARRRSACWARSSTAPPSTTKARATPRSSAGRWPSASTTSACSPRRASRSTRPPRLLEFRYAATDEQFPTIAKLRAARRLWARVLEASGAGDVPQRQHVVTSRAMMGRVDPWVNMLRGTIAAFAAGVGGADAVTVIPFDEPLGLPDALGRRIARNTSSLLIEEAHVATVADPAGGSYAVEKLTDDLAVAGWAELGRIEADGGVRRAGRHWCARSGSATSVPLATPASPTARAR